MWLLASDYDGTFYRNSTVCPENLQAVARFREAGNLFGLVTGRDIHLIHELLQQNPIPLDFVVGNNGGAIWDRDLNPISRNILSADALPELLEYLAASPVIYAVLSADQGRFLIRETAHEEYPFQEGFFRECIAARTVSSLDHPIQIDTRFSSAELAAQEADRINGRFRGVFTAYPNFSYMDIVPAGTSKYLGLCKLFELIPGCLERTCVIGDGQNDLEMIEKLEGYAVDSARPEVLLHAKGVFSEVHELIRLLLEQQASSPETV